MSEVGEDIKDALIEVGSEIQRVDGGIKAEFIDTEPNSQVTKPFIREFFKEGTFPYDTNHKAGDVIHMSITNEDWLMMNHTPDTFANEVVMYSTVLYKSNVSGEIFRPSGEVDDNYYHTVEAFELLQSNCYALLTEPLFGGGIDLEEELALIDIERNELYIPSSYGIRELDRYQPVSGEFYMVKAVKSRRFANVDVCELEEDTR